MHARRAYVLPVVLLLLLVVGMLAASTAQRQISTANTVTRQVDAYKEHHGAMGLQAAVQVWLRVQNAISIPTLLGENGHAFDLTFEDGSVISIYLRSGQGSALSDLTNLDSEDVEPAARILAHLNTNLPEEAYAARTRAVGPVAIDLSYADRHLITAGAFAVTPDPAKSERLANELFANRGGANRNTLSQAGIDAELDNDERSLMYRLFTTTTTLWRVHVEVKRGVGSGEVVARYEGLTVLNSNTSGVSTDFNVSGGFLEWGPVPLSQTPAHNPLRAP
ncbi:MAG: hypothetical protein ACF8Q5_08365 [Phycisphaerales bacterium JB040]